MGIYFGVGIVYYDSFAIEIKNMPKIQRNEPCPCGSGKKFKKCCIDLNRTREYDAHHCHDPLCDLNHDGEETTDNRVNSEN